MKNRPLTQLEIDMLTEEQMREQLVDNKRKYLKEMTDENPSSQLLRFIDYIARFAMKWIRTFAELVLNEGFLATASKWKSVNTFAKMNGYIPQQLTAARATIVGTLSRDIALGIAVDGQALRFYTDPTPGEPSIFFEYEDDTFYIPPGAEGDTFSFEVVQGRWVENESFGVSDGTELQSFITESSGVVHGSEVVEVEEYDGDLLAWVEYQPTENLLLCTPTDRVYERSYTEEGRLICTFGNATDDLTGHGYIPEANRSVRISYRKLPADEDGNVAENIITKVSPATRLFSITNPSRAQGWTDREDIESIRWNAMRYPRIQKTIGKFDDYIAKGEELCSGGRCYALANIFGNNSITVFFVTADGDVPTAFELAEYQAGLDAVNHAGEFVVASAAVFEEYSASLQMRIADNYESDEVINAVDDAITDFFDPLSRDSAGNRTVQNGDIISPSKISSIAMSVPGVMGVSVLSPTEDVAFEPTVLPKKGTIILGVV